MILLSFWGYLLVTWLVVYFTAPQYLRNVHPIFKFVSIAFPLLALGQAINMPRWTYPFDHWGMYAESNPQPVYFQFVAETQQCVQRPLTFEHLSFNSPGPLRGYSTLSPLPMRLLQLRQTCRCVSGDPTIDAFLAAVIDGYEASHDVAVRQVSIYRVIAQLQRRSHPARMLLYSWRSQPSSSGQGPPQ